MNNLRKIITKIVKIFGVLLGLFVLGNVCLYIYCLITPKIQITRNQSYYLLDNNNKQIFNNYSWVELDDISPYLLDATLSTEDKHFYKHIGFDYFRIIKAVISNISSRSLAEGASTITQQYARNLYLNYEKTWKRKIEEALLAFELETHYSKDEILEGYLNTINYGGVYGIENAAKYYFNKSAKDLSLAEAAMLAGIPQSPSNYSPLANTKLAKKRQKTVLTLMVNNDVITNEESNKAFNEKLEYIGDKETDITSGLLYFKDAVLEELKDIPNIPKSILTTGGIKIYTTLDSNAQNSLENSIKNKDLGDLQVSSILMNSENGEVLALVGGRDYNISQFNRATSAKRQVGSTMKPFLYYTALENGFTAASSFISEKTTFSFSNSKKYTPKNFNDKYANGPLCMGAAIAYSDNIFAVKTHLFLGEDKLVTMANRVGISNKLEAVPSLALGTEEISLMEMVSGYSTFANMGYKVKGHLIKKIEDSNGNILYEYKNEKQKILNESLVYILNEMLTYTYDTSFISYNYPTVISLLPKMTNKYSIKSGTTNTDMWIIGYNKNAVLGVWTGYDDNKNFNSSQTNFHKDIWIETMESYLKGKDNSWYKAPNNIVGVVVNPITGEKIGNNQKGKMFYFVKGTEPNSEEYNLDSVFQGDENNEDKNNDDKKKNESNNTNENTSRDNNNNIDNNSNDTTNNNDNNDNNDNNETTDNNDNNDTTDNNENNDIGRDNENNNSSDDDTTREDSNVNNDNLRHRREDDEDNNIDNNDNQENNNGSNNQI